MTGSVGRALHIGVPAPAPLGSQHFAYLHGVQPDIDTVTQITGASGFEQRVLFGEDATRTAVVTALRTMCAESNAGDVIVITFSGHGTQIPTADPDEADEHDEVILLADTYLSDNAFAQILERCDPDVDIIMIADACRSRTFAYIDTPEVVDVPIAGLVDFYPWDDIPTPGGGLRPPPTLLLISAVGDDSADTPDTPNGGVLTLALQAAWLRYGSQVPTWGQLLSRAVGWARAYQFVRHPQEPRAIVRGPRRTVLDAAAFTIPSATRPNAATPQPDRAAPPAELDEL